MTARKPLRILLVKATLKLSESHISLLRSIPAFVETLASCTEMYRHEGRGYALVILALHAEPREAPEAAHFARRQWNEARVLLLEDESTAMDDWLYDERVGPPFNPVAVSAAAKRLMAEQAIWSPAWR